MKLLKVKDLGLIKYLDALEIQEELFAKKNKSDVNDYILFLEHNPVFTFGRNANKSNLLFSISAIKDEGIDCIDTSRGGDVTFHGPGQLVVYPILDLKSNRLGIAEYVYKIESVIIKVLSRFNIMAHIDKDYPGVWVDNNKIAAIGIRVRRYITMHGFALNVSTDLTHFSKIIPCGIVERGVTSMKKLLDIDLSIDEIKRMILTEFKKEFGYD